MKTITLLTLSLMAIVFGANVSIAQNYKSQFPVKVESSGIIKDKTGTTFGSISKDSIINNHKGEKIAFIDRQGNLVDTEGTILGKAAKNGDFHNINGEVEFIVKPGEGDECVVYDKSGNIIAYVHNNYKAQAGCLAHCMHKNMIMK